MCVEGGWGGGYLIIPRPLFEISIYSEQLKIIPWNFDNNQKNFLETLQDPPPEVQKYLRMNKLQFLNATYNVLIWKNQALPFSQIPDMVWGLNLHWGYPLTNEVAWWYHQPDHMALFGNGFWFRKLLINRVNKLMTAYMISFFQLCNNDHMHL